MTQRSLSERDRHDGARLRALGRSREAGREDPLRERAIQAELLAGYRPWIYHIVRRRLRGVPSRQDVADDITQTIMRDVASRLARSHVFPKAFRRVVLDYIDWRIDDYWRSPSGQREAEPLAADIIAETVQAPDDMPSEGMQAADFTVRLEGLSDRDREIAVERYWNGRTPDEIAKLLGIKPNACHQACHRVARRLAASTEMQDVRQELKRTNRRSC